MPKRKQIEDEPAVLDAPDVPVIATEDEPSEPRASGGVMDRTLAKVDFEDPRERERRFWAEAGGDQAHFLLLYLQRDRAREISIEEIRQTRLYQRADAVEQRALELAAAEHDTHPSHEDIASLQERDDFLIQYADGKAKSHRNWVTEITAIPEQLADRERFDQMTFPVVFKSPKLFGWLFIKTSCAIE